MLERPSNIFECVQKCYKAFKRLITCYNELYANVRRCANRSNILYITCCITCCVTCLNGLPRAIVNDSNPLTISTKDSILDVWLGSKCASAVCETFVSLCARDHLFSTYAKFTVKLTFVTPWHAHVRVRIRK